ncbi:hypothetical protein [Mucilaginibacter sp. OK268]|uniref:hypothetical protein n=1 Tax=Mucilaginibacter sp. OK268 TaxID=1881048 RepID=UPI000B832468|nr:hypothetical protein [Mucilaginibacter sp. OK268]
MDQEKINRFYKAIDDIESLHKAEISGSLRNYFQHRIGETDSIIWITNPGTDIRNQVIDAAHKFLS